MTITIKFTSRRSADYNVSNEGFQECLYGMNGKSWIVVECEDGSSHIINLKEVEEIVVP